MQCLLMRQFFQNISLEDKQKISNRNLTGHICVNWIGLRCTDGVLTSILYHTWPLGNFRIAFVPPTVKQLEISGCYQSYTVDTRRFPRSSQIIQLNRNRIHGSIDLTSLPSRLLEFSIRQNELTGSINLTKLPHSLIFLQIDTNHIEQDALYYDNLPPSIGHISLNGCHMRIRQIYALEQSEVARGRAAFGKPVRYAVC